MKSGTGAAMNGAFIKPFFQHGNLFAAARVGPAENFCGRFPFSIDADQAVPKAAGRNVRDVAFHVRGLFQYVIHRRNDLLERLSGFDLCSAFVRRGQRPLVLNHRARQYISSVVVQSRADAGGADIESKNVLFS